jgi:uncharacterized protein (TIGR03435 family)
MRKSLSYFSTSVRAASNDLRHDLITICVFLFLFGFDELRAAPPPQEPKPGLAFDVASIRARDLTSQQNGENAEFAAIAAGFSISGTRAEIRNLPLADWIAIAHRVPVHQVSGPSWITRERFDLVATFPAGTSRAQVLSMLEQLLVERCGLSFHKESKPDSVYALVTTSRPLQLTPTKGSAGRPEIPMMPSTNGKLRIDQHDITISKLADTLSRFAGRPVVDLTGIEGAYDVALEISMMDLPHMARFTGRDKTENTPGPSLFRSVESLGLKLERRSLDIPFLVVDHISRPTPN